MSSRRTALLLAALLTMMALAFFAVLRWRESRGLNEVRSQAVEEQAAEVDVRPRIPRIENLGEVDPRLAKVVREAVAAVQRAPGEADTWGGLGRIYNAHGFITLAKQSYSIASELDPQAAAWPYYLAILATERGAARQAVRHFETATRLQPSYVPAHYRLGLAHLSAGDLTAARRAYEQVVALAPQSPWGYVGLGTTASRERRLEPAAAYLERARELDPGVHEATYLLAMTYLGLGRKQRSEELLAELDTLPAALIDDPLIQLVQDQRSDLQATIERAKKMKAQGRLEAAEAMYRSVIAYDPEHFEAHSDLGVLYAQSARHESAVPHLEKATSLRPTNAAAHLNLAMLYFEMGRREQSMRETKRALELDPRHLDARRLLEALAAGHEPSSPG